MQRFHVKQDGFTLIELLVVVAIIGILSSVVLSALGTAREEARLAKSEQDLRSMRNALELYANRHNGYPPDQGRGVPSGAEQYMESGEWPLPAWKGSVFDWDKWNIGGDVVYQLSIRFCEQGGGIESCNFPGFSWADDFDTHSAVYFCVEGPCRSHVSRPADHPGYCINCNEE